MNKIKVRTYQDSDTKELVAIFYNTIHKINSKDYTAEQINAWAPKLVLDLEHWQNKWQTLKPIVAVIDNTICGFAEITSEGFIDCFYVHHEHQGEGVGTALMTEVFRYAKECSVPIITAEVSITAKPFFLNKGFAMVKEQLLIKRQRGRNGLDVLNNLKKITKVFITEINGREKEVDLKLVEFAKNHKIIIKQNVNILRTYLRISIIRSVNRLNI